MTHHPPHRRASMRCRLLPLAAAACTLFGSIGHARAFQPINSWSSSSAFVENQALYILGGTLTAQLATPSLKTFMIDLSVPWNAIDPVYEQLPDAPSANSTASALSSDGMTWFTLLNGNGYIYNVKTMTWSRALTDGHFSTQLDLSATTDPNSNIVYVPNGYQDAGAPRLLTVSLTSKVIQSAPMPPGLDTSSQMLSAWNYNLKSLIVFAKGLYSYNAAGWKDLSASVKGVIPSPRTGSCFASTAGGSKLVLFGGKDVASKSTLHDIYILDVETLTWTRGVDVDPENSRSASACAISNNQFIAWGGIRSTNGQLSSPHNMTLVYDLTTTAWTSRYMNHTETPRMGAEAPPTTASGDAQTETSSFDNRLKFIIGFSVAGAVILLGIVIGFFLCRMQAKRRAARSVGAILAREEERAAAQACPCTTPRPATATTNAPGSNIPHGVSDVKASPGYNQCPLPAYESVQDMPISTSYIQELTSYGPSPTFEETIDGMQMNSKKLGPPSSDAQENESGVIFYSMRMNTLEPANRPIDRPVNNGDPMATYRLPDGIYSSDQPPESSSPRWPSSPIGSSSSGYRSFAHVNNPRP
ncbi:hypothetical protein BGX34_008261 [Mortierella sp. NVP85]|nr:hypothetical protein BGX34_008261 [Mortierella sp. NVP85]